MHVCSTGLSISLSIHSLQEQFPLYLQPIVCMGMCDVITHLSVWRKGEWCAYMCCESHSLQRTLFKDRTSQDVLGTEIPWDQLNSLSLSLSSHKTYWILWFRKSRLPELINFAWKHCSIWFTAPSGFINLEQSNKTNSTTLIDALLRCDGAFMSHSAINKQAIRIEWSPGCILA